MCIPHDLRKLADWTFTDFNSFIAQFGRLQIQPNTIVSGQISLWSMEIVENKKRRMWTHADREIDERKIKRMMKSEKDSPSNICRMMENNAICNSFHGLFHIGVRLYIYMQRMPFDLLVFNTFFKKIQELFLTLSFSLSLSISLPVALSLSSSLSLTLSSYFSLLEAAYILRLPPIKTRLFLFTHIDQAEY